MRLWRELERMSAWAGVESVWRDALGPELERARPLLRPMEDLALSVPLGPSSHHRVVAHGEDDVVAVCPETGEVVPIERGLLVIHRLDGLALLALVSASLGLAGEPAPVEGSRRLWWLGEFMPLAGVRFPVYLTAQGEPEDVASSAGRVLALDDCPMVLATLTRAAAGTALNAARTSGRLGWFALEDVLEWGERGTFRVRRTLVETLRPFLARHCPTTVADESAPRYPTPPGSRWGDVSIRFLDAHKVSVRVGAESHLLTFADMGMAHKRTREPTQQWDLLYAFAKEHGTLTWSSRAASPKNQKRKERLAGDLRAFFGIDSEPFEPLEGGWKARFTVEPD